MRPDRRGMASHLLECFLDPGRTPDSVDGLLLWKWGVLGRGSLGVWRG